MNGMEIPVARLLRNASLRHGLTLSLMGLGLYVALGAAGLFLDRLAESGTEGQAGHERWGIEGTRGAVMAWNAPEPPARWAGDSNSSRAFGSDLDSSAPIPAMRVPTGTPLVLVADGLDEFEAEPVGERSLLLEPDGTLRTESTGTLVGFLHAGQSPREGDLLEGPGQIEFRLLHHDSWLADRVRVPVVEEDGTGRWIVRDYRTFRIEVEREPRRAHRRDPGRPKLHQRTGLPQVELVSWSE